MAAVPDKVPQPNRLCQKIGVGVRVLYGFSIKNFRNFGPDEQWVSPLGRVNIIVGPNNSGKSNVLRYIKRILAPAVQPSRTEAVQQLEIDRPRDGGQVSQVSIWAPFPPDNILGQGRQWEKRWIEAFAAAGILDKSQKFIKLAIPTANIPRGEWYQGPVPKVDALAQQNFHQIWQMLVPQTGGSYEQHWFRGAMNRVTGASLPTISTYYVPSFRHIPSRMEAFQDEFSTASDAEHIIDRLAGLAYPSYNEQEKKKDFERLRRFIGSIIGDDKVVIEIPNDRLTVNVNTGGQFLPIEALGSGIHEVFMLASDIVSRSSETILLEEPEVHLHPALQRRFMQFIVEETKSQIFITTHSATIIDTPGTHVFEVSGGSNAVIRTINSSAERFAACRELGFRASDLVQANCVIWVEGPSDRIYLLKWLREVAPDLGEGAHFSIMFYGGKLLSRLTLEEEALDDFVQLLPICRYPAILIDSDKSGGNSKIRETKLRVAEEFAERDAFWWITEGREIENFYSFEDRLAAVSAVHQNVLGLTGGKSRYDKPISFKRSGDDKEVVADKIAIANYLTENARPAIEVDAFQEKLSKLVAYIRHANR